MEVVGAVGLQNQGSTCYMNSALQCLAHTPQLASFFLASDKIKGVVACEFLKLVKGIWDPDSTGSSLVPGSKLAGKFYPGQQQDAHEYLMFLLNALHEELKQQQQQDPPKIKGKREQDPPKMKGKWEQDAPKKSGIKGKKVPNCEAAGKTSSSSPVADIFEGQTRSTRKCPRCCTAVSALENFTVLSLPVPVSQDSLPISLESCLKELTRDETLDSWYCSKCKRNQAASKKLELAKLPSNLILHLTRMKCDSAGNVKKMDRAVDFPDRLDCLDGLYRLQGIIEHTGDAEYGHYTTTIRLDGGEWYKFNDETIENVEPPKCSTDVYILFYSKEH